MHILQYHCISLFLFFKVVVDHRDLHSFPTRRSSDLEEQAPGATPVPARDPMLELTPVEAAVRAHQGETRSEEHTSELQSRGHLVCRLLLEKKKEGYSKNSTGSRP